MITQTKIGIDSPSNKCALAQEPICCPSTDELRKDIIAALRQQGYKVKSGRIELREDPDKNYYRALNRLSVAKKLAVSGPGIKRHEDRLIQFIANGDEIVPEAISPKLVPVESGSEYELLFRYVYLHWSIPVSAGYGRRLRFLVIDESNDKLMGIFGLGDPVYSMKARDDSIGWDAETKKRNLYHIMDAFVLGAVPPYSNLICGKLIAMLTLSNEVRQTFRLKYKGNCSLINRSTRPPWLTMLTTTSALGRSSIYNRIRVNGIRYWSSVGFTQGSGEFHFSNGVYDSIRAYVHQHCHPTAKNPAWGTGFRNKREVVKKCLSSIGLSTSLLYHGIPREVFIAPLGEKAHSFLRGETSRPHFYDWASTELSALFIERWLLPRAKRVQTYRDFDKESYRLWPKTK